MPKDRARDPGLILVTGASGQIGMELCRRLRVAKHNLLAVDLDSDPAKGIAACDLRQARDVAQLFEQHPIRGVIHLAGILPGALRSDPCAGAEVNLNCSVALLRHATQAGVQRFVFASSMSVYGTSASSRPLSEDDPAAPDEAYGGSKRAIELLGQALSDTRGIEFVALRMARVVGPGAKRTSSLWRSQLFETPSRAGSLLLPFAPRAALSLVHVEDVAGMLLTLLDSPKLRRHVFNTPVEIWEAGSLKETIEQIRGIRIELGNPEAHGGPQCDGSLFVREFGFQLRGLKQRLLAMAGNLEPRSI